MKTKGGYAMVDLGHVSLSGTGVTFAGLYQKLYSKIGKPILLCNVNIGGTEYQDCYVQPVYTANGFEMTVGDYTIVVTSVSAVTATSGIVGGGTEIPELNPDGAGEVLTNIGEGQMGWRGVNSSPFAEHSDVAIAVTGSQSLPSASGNNITLSGSTLDGDELEDCVASISSSSFILLENFSMENSGQGWSIFALGCARVYVRVGVTSKFLEGWVLMSDKNGVLYVANVNLKYDIDTATYEPSDSSIDIYKV